MMKRNLALLVLLALLGGGSVCAQQITKFGVVDTARVYEAFFRDTGPVRNYEKKRADFQKEVDRLTQELKELQARRAEAQKSKNAATVQRLDAQISQKTEYLKEYTNARNMELENMRHSLQTSDSFYKKLYSTLERIAEGGGYSMILSLQDSNSILWYSPSVDVTDEVISALGL